MTHQQSDDWTPAECLCLDTLLDVLLPAAGDLPAAGALGVRSFLAERVGDTEGFGDAIAHLLAKASELLAAADAASLDALGDAERIGFVQRLEAAEPASFLKLTTQAFLGYYTEPSIPPRFGLPDRPPQPLGHTLPEDDLEPLVEPVRQRGKCYVEC